MLSKKKTKAKSKVKTKAKRFADKKKSSSTAATIKDILSLPETYKKFLDSIEDFVFIRDKNSKILWANKALVEFYGMSAKKLRNKYDAPFNALDYTMQSLKDDQYVFTSGQTLHNPEEPVILQDGKTYWMETVKSPIFDKTGKVIMTVGVARNITEKRIHEQAMIEQQKQNLISTAKMATLGEMAGGIAHEITSPLAILQILLDQVGALGDSEVIDKNALKAIVRQGNKAIGRVSKIISTVGSFARTEINEENTNFLLGEIFKDAISFCELKLKGKNVKVEVDPSVENILIQGLPSEMSQVFINLINNSCDAVAGLPERWIHLSATTKNEITEVKIKDSGAGLPLEVSQQMFHQSFTTKPVGKGTGLGLIITKKIIEKHKGKIFIDSSNPNTCFVIQFPKVENTEILVKIAA